jgi:hypothetical protein
MSNAFTAAARWRRAIDWYRAATFCTPIAREVRGTCDHQIIGVLTLHKADVGIEDAM